MIPTLFVIVDAGSRPIALAIPDVEGTALVDEPSELLRLETSFAIDADDPAGVVTANLVAVPEPSGGLVAVLSVLVLASRIRSSLPGAGSSGREAAGRGGRGRVRETDT